ncbi:MAG: DJ-1/PfpI family protein [Phenylobacterium sp.]|uniref:DJ-1/PfpI family protein n=1 Tax=Phenylobacterium sp. TaxID=1871053 RepID=UPI001A3722E8|nr:DJ-1/PfpI family protein [Phenylobacterium sp.]MBL8554683.1 DJ-1/PfpI family protein [Phenylobacterium sp.]
MRRLVAGAMAALGMAMSAPATGAAARPLVVILAQAEGTEVTDLFTPYAILAESGAVDVRVVAASRRPARLTSGVAWVTPQMTFAELASSRPDGPDVVIVPALAREDDPALLAWLRAQAKGGARIMSVCNGGRVLAATGLLDGRQAAVHWFSVAGMARAHPKVTWRRDARWVEDGPFISTTGISASAPATLNLLRELSGEATMQATAQRLGLPPPQARHDGTAYRLSLRHMTTVAGNVVATWGHQDVAVPLTPGFDEIAFATTIDGWSRTFRSKAWATGPAVVTSRHGLTVRRARTPPAAFDRRIALPARDPMVATFQAIRGAYGDRTARFVATQFEHPWAVGGRAAFSGG